MVFFDRLKNIKKRLDDAYIHGITPITPMKTIADFKTQIGRLGKSMKAINEARDDIELLLSLTMEDPQHIALQGQHSLKKDALYQLLDITKPTPRAPIGVTKLRPMVVEKKEAESS